MALCTDAKIFDKELKGILLFIYAIQGFPENKSPRFQALVKQYWKQNKMLILNFAVKFKMLYLTLEQGQRMALTFDIYLVCVYHLCYQTNWLSSNIIKAGNQTSLTFDAGSLYKAKIKTSLTSNSGEY